jgi:hypothetical protein
MYQRLFYVWPPESKYADVERDEHLGHPAEKLTSSIHGLDGGYQKEGGGPWQLFDDSFWAQAGESKEREARQ